MGPVGRRARKSVWLEQGKWVKIVRNKVRVRLQRTFGVIVRTLAFIRSKMGSIKGSDQKSDMM